MPQIIIDYPEQCPCGFPVDWPEQYCPICLCEIHREFDVVDDDQPSFFFVEEVSCNG